MKKILLTAILILISSFTFAQKKPETLVVALDWFPNPDHAPIIIAKQQGFFKEQGLDVQLIGPSDPNDPPKWVAAGKADIGITYEPKLMEQIDQGLPLISIGTLIDKPLDCIVALKESGIKRIKDLKGKRIGTADGSLMSMMLQNMLASRGISSNEVKIINVKYNLTQALLSHQVDAVTGIMRNFEIPQIEQLNKKVVAFFPEEHGIPSYSVLVFIANINKSHDPRFLKFLDAVKKGVAYLDAHPKETWKQFAKDYPESNNEVNKAAWFATMPYFAEEPSIIDQKDWSRFANYLKQHHLIKKIQPSSRYALVETKENL